MPEIAASPHHRRRRGPRLGANRAALMRFT
jgi:hypothetical protein